MAIERRNPVPPGTYSLFLNTADIPVWQAWLTRNTGKVFQNSSIDKYVLEDASADSSRGIFSWGALFSFDGDLKPIKKLVGADVFFTVKSPVEWVGIGLPNIEKSVGDWVKESTELPPIEDPLAEFKRLALIGAGVYLGGILLKGIFSK